MLSDPDATETVGSPVESALYFGKLPRALVRNPAIGVRAKVLYALLDDYASRKEGEAWPSRKRLAADLGCSPASVTNALTELVSAGWLTRRQRYREDGSQASNAYLLHAQPVQHVSAPPTNQLRGGGTNPLRGTPTNQLVAIKDNHNEVEPLGSNHGEAVVDPALLHQHAATLVYDATGGAINFGAVMAIAKWVIYDRGVHVDTAANAMVRLYQLGKPITRSTVGQLLDGHIDANGGQRRDRRTETLMREFNGGAATGATQIEGGLWN